MKEGYSQIRNRALAHAFSYMNLIEGWGTGVPRLLREMKEYGLPEPEFVDMEIALRINLYRAQTDTKTIEETNTNQETSLETNQETDNEKDSRTKILAEIRNNPSITQMRLAEKVGLSRSGVRYIMRQLQDEGVLKRSGSTKKGQWIIKEN